MTSFQQRMRLHADAADAASAASAASAARVAGAVEQRYVVAMCWQLKGLFGIRPELVM